MIFLIFTLNFANFIGYHTNLQDRVLISDTLIIPMTYFLISQRN